jgi:hypothetical protein
MGQIDVAIRLDEDDAQALRIERHGYVNLINVVHAELQLIERMLDAPGSLRPTIFLAERASRAFREPAFIDGHEHSLCQFRSLVLSAVAEAREKYDPRMQNADVAEAVDILDSVIADAGCRVHEVLARHQIARPYDNSSGVALPIGLLGAIERLVIELQMHCSEGAQPRQEISESRIDIFCESQLTEMPIAALGEGLAPSVLHEQIKAGTTVLRPIMELYYHTVPNGAVSIEQDEDGFRLRAELG